MPRVTITNRQRDPIYQQLRRHLSNIDDVRTFADADHEEAGRRALQYADDFRLFEDLGWERADPRDSIRLTMPPTDLRRVLMRLQAEAEGALATTTEEEREEREWQAETREESVAAREACRDLAAGGVPAKVVAYLQAHPETNVLIAGFGELLNGVTAAMKTAGLAEKVKVIGNGPVGEPEAAILKAEEAAGWWANSTPEYGLLWADAVARLSTGTKIPQKIYEEESPHWLCRPKTASECESWTGPKNNVQQYEELWNSK